MTHSHHLRQPLPALAFAADLLVAGCAGTDPGTGGSASVDVRPLAVASGGTR